MFVRETPDTVPDAASLPGRTVVIGDAEPAPGAVDLGRFEEVSSYSRRDAEPDPVRAAGIMLVLLDNEDPEHEADFNAWYDGVHMPDVTAAAGFWGGRRYRNVAADPGPYSAGNMAIYVTDNPDVLAEYAELAKVAPGWVRWHASRRFHVAVYRNCSI